MTSSMNIKKRRLNNFLAGCRTRDQPSTNTMIPGKTPKGERIYGGKFTIDTPEKETKFFKTYSEHIKNGFVTCLTELHKEFSPMKFDLDFRFPVPEGNKAPVRKYTMKDIQVFLGVFWGIFNEYFAGIDLSDTRFHTYIQEKSGPRIEKNIVKDGLHIMFPNIVTDPRVMYVIRAKLIQNKTIIKLFKDMGCSNPVDDIIDKSVIQNTGWFMYGSSKPDGEPYKLTHIYTQEFKEVKHKYSMDELILIQSIRRWRPKDEFLPTTNPDYKESFDRIFQEYDSLPSKMSKKKERKSSLKPMKQRHMNERRQATPETVAYVKELCGCLSEARADNYQSWIAVGWALHNIDYGLLPEWITFSKKSNKFEDGVCEREWDYMRSEGLGLGSISMWARQDNIKLYTQIINKNLESLLKQVKMDCTPADMAKIIYKKYRYLYVCINASKKEWFQFREHRWYKMQEGIELRKIFSNEIVILFEEYRQILLDRFRVAAQSAEFNDEAIKDGEEKINKPINKVVAQLKKTSFKKNLLEECAELFYDKDFEVKLDSNPYLIGFENGVYDLENDEFRDGYPEDYVSFTTGNNYIDFDEDSPEVQNVWTFLSQVIPKRAVRNYTIGYLATCLCGKLYSERFHIFTGSGGNGKSKLTDLFKSCFNDYCYNMPISLLTKTRNGGESASPVMAATRGKRFITLQEPENDSKLNTGYMKELTGGDTITARPLFKDPIQFKPQFKMTLICNDMPDPSASDDGTWRRIRVVAFISRFCDNPSDDPKKYEFPIDEKLDEKLDLMKEAFMWVLLERFKKFKNVDGYKLTEPEEVKAATNKYKADMDQFSEFMDVTFIHNEGSSESMKKSDIWPLYKEWFSKNKNGRPPPWGALCKAMEKKYGKYRDSCGFKGLQKKNESFTSEEDEMEL